MKNNTWMIKTLALTGTIILWLPLAAPLAFGAASALSRQRLLIDYLMPAELFPLAAVGGILLLMAAWLAHDRLKLVGWSLAAALAALITSLVIASASGLANGSNESPAWMAVVLACLAVYTAGLAAAGVGGILLVNDLLRGKGQLA